MNNLSLSSRLLIYILLIAMLIWGTASALGWLQTRNAIDEIFDTQQLLFAKRLASASLSELTVDNVPARELPKTRSLIKHGDKGNLDDDALGFAIFNHRGELLLSDSDHGNEFGYSTHSGFLNKRLEGDDDEEWRILYITTPDKRYTIAVGQERDYRDDLVQDIVLGQLWPWFIGLPLMMALTAWIVRRELMSLRRTAATLGQRSPEDATPLEETSVPKEARPLVTALNALFVRISGALEHERQFTADAAHELRSPLTALRIQSEVALLAEEDKASRNRALNNLIVGIDRTSRLVDQLLALSRLDGTASLMNDLEHIDWRQLAAEVTEESLPVAQHKNIALETIIESPPQIVQGNRLLLKMLLSNLVNNALRYTQNDGEVQITLRHSGLSVTDNGPGVMPSHLTRLGERFFRPPGAVENGSGLGLSIVKRIARLHEFDIQWRNRPEGGFQVTLAQSAGK
ncbi:MULTISPECIES: quorum sensing histidine kinase QseC [Tenebrionibacter/Tenebrionicola group]|jgi:two-component system sensor histidine kinase QseC|uniref:Sensor protein QseC n=2 Tax=Tenebrionibacter/Tenebrionicola group TaxID=2969848 RepID=A0A8K0XX09_9ENTR|nr:MULTISPECIES: quorum sensing histidine kinase QseC [Tenebrionibacter/Tenebrionicola group]MBK4714872.1 two-component system sensor histidine kinase QseC [Tenebrionibacter intestinalis]MBV4414111.1 two-component system sensor histidine kinase QseC [Tenebrionicola larvae]MBV5095569.1 two-component system sensor histidine kinase QseC [Tenebrionicola larvae]